MRLYNATRGRWLAVELRVASGFFSRLIGLLGRRSLPDEQGLLIAPCDSIHTIGMRFPIDVVFLDRRGQVLRVVEALKPWRVILPVKRAAQVIELPAYTVRKSGTEVGDQLELIDGRGGGHSGGNFMKDPKCARRMNSSILVMALAAALFSTGCVSLRAGIRKLLVAELSPSVRQKYVGQYLKVRPRVTITESGTTQVTTGGKTGDELATYREQALLRPEDPLVRLHLGRLYLERNLLDQAAFELDMATSFDPKMAEGFLLLGRVLRMKGQLDLAIAKLRAAVQLDPTYVEAYVELGICWDQRGFYERAREAYRAAMRLRPDDATIYNNMGVSYSYEGDSSNALKYFKKALALDPNNIQANNNIALMAAERRDYSLAFDYFCRAHGEAVAHSNVGYLLLRAGSYDEAIKHLREAARLRPNALATLANLELALRATGKVAEAEEIHAQYLKAKQSEETAKK